MDQPWQNRIVGHGEESPEQLAANPRNWRIHPERQQRVLEGAIRDVGYLRSVTVNKRTGYVLDGHLRVSLAISSGQETIPVEYVDLSEAQEAEALATLDPIAGMAATHEEQLGHLIAGIEEADAHVLDFLTEQQQSFSNLPQEGLTDPNDVPEPPLEPVSRRGDVWLLGEHRVMCGDARSAEDSATLTLGKKPALLHIDPPYGISIVAQKEGLGTIGGSKAFGSTSGTNRASSTVEASARRGSSLDGPASKNQLAPAGIYPVMQGDSPRRKQGYVGGGEPATKKIIQSNVYPAIEGDDEPFEPQAFLELAPITIMWGANYYAGALPTSSCWICWDKREGITRNTFADCELAWCSRPGPARVFHHLWNGLHKGSQWGERRSHPTEKPVALFEEIGKMYADGTLWLDLFAGTGAQVIAAERSGATCYAMEIEPQYVDVICRRYQLYTGTLPILEATGEPHDFSEPSEAPAEVSH